MKLLCPYIQEPAFSECAFQLIGETTLPLPIRPKVAERSCTNCVEMYRLSLNAVCWMSNCCWIADYLNSQRNSIQCLFVFKNNSISRLKRNSLVCEGLGWEAEGPQFKPSKTCKGYWLKGKMLGERNQTRQLIQVCALTFNHMELG